MSGFGQVFAAAVTGIDLTQRAAGHALLAQASATAFAGKGVSLSNQQVEIVAIFLEAFALVEDFAIPVETEHFKVAQNLLAGTGDHSRGIDVFDAQ